ncbi:hypothetical protein [Pseudomonas syringae]|nr:hypothetical protein [Pseudomonas syringae]
MNIIGIAPALTSIQMLSKPVVAGTDQDLPGTQKAEDPGQARAKAFYSREEEPWKGKTYFYSEFGGPKEERPLTKEMYLDDLKSFSNLELRIQQSIYARIVNELGVFRPDLASKNFSYTLGDNAEIKILNPDRSLSEGDLHDLEKIFNSHRKFKGSVSAYAKMAMTLVDHDDKAFGGKYKLDLSNIQNILDFGKLIMEKPQGMGEALVRQVLEKGEKRDQALVDVIV